MPGSKRFVSHESNIQKAVFQHIRTRGVPGLFAFHPPNGGYRRRAEAAILSGMGVVPGVPDIILIHAGRVYGLELKRSASVHLKARKKGGGGYVSEAQFQAHEAMREAGAFVSVAYGLDRAILTLETWGLLRGKANISVA